MKQETENYISIFIKNQLKGIKIDVPVTLHFTWYEPTKKRDLDGISSYGRKCIQDALVKCGVLQNDGWKWVKGFTDTFYVDSKNPRIEVVIKEVLP